MFDNERLRQRRLDMGLTQEEVGEVLGISRSAVQKHEKGIIKNVACSTVELFAQALHCSPAYLMGWTDDCRTEQQKQMAETPLSGEEKFLLAKFSELNREGQEKLLDYADDLVSSGKYIKNNQAGVGTAKMA